MLEKFLKLNQRNVIHETFDDEVVIVNLDTGSYYSLTQAGAAIWKLVVPGASVAQVRDFIASQYEGDAAEMEQSIQKFLDDLVAEKLIEPANESSATPRAEIKPAASRVPFETPTLNKYTDMEELLLLDPIHEVGDLGWPSAKTTLT